MMKSRKKRGESKLAFHYSQGWCKDGVHSHHPKGSIYTTRLAPWGARCQIDISTLGMLEHLTHLLLDHLTHGMLLETCLALDT